MFMKTFSKEENHNAVEELKRTQPMGRVSRSGISMEQETQACADGQHAHYEQREAVSFVR